MEGPTVTSTKPARRSVHSSKTSIIAVACTRHWRINRRARYGAMGGALARGLLPRGKLPTGGCCAADPNRNLSLIIVSHLGGAVHVDI
jgi:hypothetical protein